MTGTSSSDPGGNSQLPPATTRILAWRPHRKGALLGFGKVAFPSGVVLAEIAIMRGPSHAWCAPPTRPMMRGGELVRNTNGKIRQLDLIEFMDRDVKDRWSHSIIAALRAQYPNFDSDDGQGCNYSEHI